MVLSVRLKDVPAGDLESAYKGIGHFITATADMDGALSALLASIMGAKASAQDVMVHSIEFNKKCEIIKAMCAFSPAATLAKRLIKPTRRAEAVMKKRHVAAHGMLGLDCDRLVLMSLNLPAIGKYSRKAAEFLDVAELDDLSRDAEAITDEFLELIRFLREEDLAIKPANSMRFDNLLRGDDVLD